MKSDPIAVALRAIVAITAAAGALIVIIGAHALPPFAVVCYLVVFAFAAAIAAFTN